MQTNLKQTSIYAISSGDISLLRYFKGTDSKPDPAKFDNFVDDTGDGLEDGSITDCTALLAAP